MLEYAKMLKFYIFLFCSLTDLTRQNDHDKELFVNNWEHYSIFYFFHRTIPVNKWSLYLLLYYEPHKHVPTHLHVFTVLFLPLILHVAAVEILKFSMRSNNLSPISLLKSTLPKL